MRNRTSTPRDNVSGTYRVRGVRLLDQDEPGFWESLGYRSYGDPWREQRFWDD